MGSGKSPEPILFSGSGLWSDMAEFSQGSEHGVDSIGPVQRDNHSGPPTTEVVGEQWHDVSTCRGGGASGGVPASAGAYRRASSSTRVANILGSSEMMMGYPGGGENLEELEGSQSVLRVAFPSDEPLTRHTNSSPAGTIRCLTAFRSVRTIVRVNDGAFFGRQQLEMVNLG